MKPDWMKDLYGYVRCPQCNHRYLVEEMTVAGANGHAYLLACKCARCGLDSRFAVVSKEEAVVPKKRDEAPLITMDEVLDAHEAFNSTIHIKDVLS